VDRGARESHREAGEHPAHVVREIERCAGLVDGYASQPHRDLDAGDQLQERPSRDRHVAHMVTAVQAAIALRDVGRDRHHGALDLDHEPESLVRRQPSGQGVHRDGQVHAALPDDELPMPLRALEMLLRCRRPHGCTPSWPAHHRDVAPATAPSHPMTESR